MRLAVGADHAGFALKEELAVRLRSAGHELVDVGTFDPASPVDYPDYAEAVGRAVAIGEASKGVLICGSGIGASIAANKILESAAVSVTTRTRRARASNTTT